MLMFSGYLDCPFYLIPFSFFPIFFFFFLLLFVCFVLVLISCMIQTYYFILSAALMLKSTKINSPTFAVIIKSSYFLSNINASNAKITRTLGDVQYAIENGIYMCIKKKKIICLNVCFLYYYWDFFGGSSHATSHSPIYLTRLIEKSFTKFGGMLHVYVFKHKLQSKKSLSSNATSNNLVM